MNAGYNGQPPYQPPYPGAPPPQPWGAGAPAGAGYPAGPGYPPGAAYSPMLVYQPPPPAPPRPQRPWPLRKVNLWMSAGVALITLLAVLLAALAPRAAAGPPSTAGLQPLYQSSLTTNDDTWVHSKACQFTSDGLLIVAQGVAAARSCALMKDFPHDLLIKVRLVGAEQIAAVEFLSGYVLEIYGSGRYQLSRLESNGNEFPLFPRGALNEVPIGAGSIALHPSTLGTSTRPNDLTILVQGSTYAFYANGQLLTRYSDSSAGEAGPIQLHAIGGQALFTDLAVFPAP